MFWPEVGFHLQNLTQVAAWTPQERSSAAIPGYAALLQEPVRTLFISDGGGDTKPGEMEAPYPAAAERWV